MFCDDRKMDDFMVLADILLCTQPSGPFQRDPFTGATSVESEAPAAEPRALVAERLRATAGVVGFYGHDPLLTALAGLRRQRHDLDASMRRLLAHRRKVTPPAPHRPPC